MQVLVSRILLGAVIAGALAAFGITLLMGLTARGRIRLAIHDAQRLLYAELGWPLPVTPDLRLNERLAVRAWRGATRCSSAFSSGSRSLSFG